MITFFNGIFFLIAESFVHYASLSGTESTVFSNDSPDADSILTKGVNISGRQGDSIDFSYNKNAELFISNKNNLFAVEFFGKLC